ncbi:Uncharacterised protein [Mycobacteroides abscessus subsp. massiliense]|nr:Uncharacterised protein [Mycobacteroides abscessus subsp. massiliense]SKV24482.1 Uncharacterised protein [Mycobacteroides abscessus subsp. massiliense]SKV54891.1 Uncharacterised protein [Mycobacteroides abscessus subsp. massiliense]
MRYPTRCIGYLHWAIRHFLEAWAMNHLQRGELGEENATRGACREAVRCEPDFLKHGVLNGC